MLTLQLQLIQRISPHGWMRGCHSSPFSKTSPLNRHPPCERISISVRTCASSSNSSVSLLTGSRAKDGVVGAGVGGHCLQQAIGSGLNASLSGQLSGGQVSLLHSTFNVTAYMNKDDASQPCQSVVHYLS